MTQAAEEHDCQVHAYGLMTNHVHIWVSPARIEGLGKMMQMLGRYYIQYFNYNYQRTGTLWEGRYKASLISSEQYLFTCMCYIELNPVRAGMVEDPSEYRWSSYHHNAHGISDSLIQPHLDCVRLGKTLEEQQAGYKALFQIPLELRLVHKIRESTNKCWTLGDSRFKTSVAEQLGRRVEPIVRGGDRKSKRYIEIVKINTI